jgi:hypothetical protein
LQDGPCYLLFCDRIQNLPAAITISISTEKIKYFAAQFLVPAIAGPPDIGFFY